MAISLPNIDIIWAHCELKGSARIQKMASHIYILQSEFSMQELFIAT